MAKNPTTYCGFIAVTGRPNVGKSTLTNALLGKKISITSKKPQTTRHKILGILTNKNYQFIFCDLPGIHKQTYSQLNRVMVKTALTALHDVDAILWLLEAGKWHEEDELILKKMSRLEQPKIIALNKIDRLKNKDLLLPFIERLQEKLKKANIQNYEIIPISAKNGKNVTRIIELLQPMLPRSPFLYDANQITDRNFIFIAREFIREQLMRYLGEEVPHQIDVQIEKIFEKNKILHIYAIILVARPGQKKIVIGENGEKLKTVGQLARLALEKYIEKKIFLKLWVKVKSGWTDNPAQLKILGYDEST